MIMAPLSGSSTNIVIELSRYRSAKDSGDLTGAWQALERAHVLAQPRLGMHLKVHAAMLGFAVAQRDPMEIAGQLLRLALAPVGAAIGRVPTGNTGRANVSAYAPMAIPADLREALAQGERS